MVSKGRAMPVNRTQQADQSLNGAVSMAEDLARLTGEARGILGRHLLVLGADGLAMPWVAALRENGWHLLLADSEEEARKLCRKHDVFAGLALLEEPLTDATFQRVRHTVIGLRDLEWVAVLSREDLRRADVRRFVVGRLRDYQVYPVDPIRLTVALGHAWGLAALTRIDRQAQSTSGGGRFGLIGTSLPMRRLYTEIERVAETGLPVLITGETGTGKELVARAIHEQSMRAAHAFVALNCAAIPASLMQSELFGFAKGAFTGASSSNKGLIQTAQGGTLLLDEIGEMPLPSQATLLRFLEDKTVTPVGGRTSVSVDVTVIASTNRNLHNEVRQGRFRQDLLYRLDVLSIQTPALRERGSDIDALAEYFLAAAAASLPRRLRGFTDDALDWLRAQSWPGNVRELRSCVLQAGLRCAGDEITDEDLGQVQPTAEVPEPSLDTVVERTKKGTLEHILARNRGNVSKTARDLRISRMTLYRLMAKHNIARQ
jgi:DNA-binding NtrC family response regulator